MLVPYHLINERFSGSVMAIILSPFIGAIMLYMFTNALTKFPGEGLPEIFDHFYPRWLVSMIMIYKSFITGTSAAIVLSTYAVIITRFLNPEGNPYGIVLVLMVVCAFAATRSTVTVNFVLEIVLILSFPFVGFVLYKAIKSPLMNWDAVAIVAEHYNKMPSLLVIASATFVFTGFLNLSIFNRTFPTNFRFKYRWLLVLIAFIDLLMIFFIPIGVHGTEAVEHYVYIWSATADSTKMAYGFIERVLFLFLIVLLHLALAFTMVGWHMSIEFLRYLLPNNIVNPDEAKTPLRSYVIAGGILLITFSCMFFINQLSMFQLGGYFMIIRMFSEFVIVIWVYLLSKKKVRRDEKRISI